MHHIDLIGQQLPLNTSLSTMFLLQPRVMMFTYLFFNVFCLHIADDNFTDDR
jgi:hypothetical protein